MAVFERPARHRSRSGEAGGRCLKKISPGFAVAKYVGFTPLKALGVSVQFI